MHSITILTILFGVGIIDNCSGSSVYGCDLVGLNICAWELGQNISKITPNNQYVIPSAADVKVMCRYNDAFERCYRRKLSGCSNNLIYITSFAATQRTMEFLCVDAFESIISHSKCWEQDHVLKETHVCYHEHLRQIQRNIKRLSQDNFLERSWCRMIHKSKLCMHSVIKERCVSSAVKVVDEMMDAVMEDLATFMDCRYEGEYRVPSEDDESMDFLKGLHRCKTNSADKSFRYEEKYMMNIVMLVITVLYYYF